MEERFSVWQFSTPEFGNVQEKVRDLVNLQEAMRAFGHYTNNVATKVMGATARVIVTDGGDCIVAEWKKNEGYTFPPELAIEAKKRGL